MAEMTNVRCDGCGAVMPAAVEHMGQHAQCQSCGETFLMWPVSKSVSWFVQASGATLGPFEPAALRGLVTAGRIQASTLIRKGAEGAWVRADQVRGLLDGKAAEQATAMSAPSTRPGHGAASRPPSTQHAGRGAQASRRRGSTRAQPARRASRRPPRDDLAASLARRPGLLIGLALGTLALVGAVVHFGKEAMRGAPERLEERASAAPSATPSAAAPVPYRAQAPGSTSPSPRAPAGPLKAKDIVKQAAPSVALVMGREGFGTGFMIRPNLVATNRHVIADELMRNVKLKFPDAPKPMRGSYGTRLVYEDPELDLAFLEVTIDLPPLPLAPRHAFTRGEDIVVIGNPGLGDGQVLNNALSRGIMSTEGMFDGVVYHQLDIAINPGNSGGPVFDDRGHVIGVVTLRAFGKDGLGFSIPLESLKASLSRAKATSRSQSEAMDATHRFKVISAAVLRSAHTYVLGGQIYVTAMETALEAKTDMNEALRTARGLLDRRLFRIDGGLISLLRADAPKVIGDRRLPDAARERFRQLWALYNEVKDHVSHPTGTFEVFKAKCETFRTARNNLAAEFGARHGVGGVADDE